MRRFIYWFLLSYLRFFAKVALSLHKPAVIGITGSVGKSSVRDAIYTLLKDYFPTKLIEKGNSETGVPLGLLGLQVQSLGFETPLKSISDWLRIIIAAPFGIHYLRNTEYLVVEMGVDEPYPPKNMRYLLTIVKPNIAVFLNVYPVHTMQFEKALSDTEKKLDDEKRLKLIQKLIAAEKGRIVTDNHCNTVVYNADDSFVTSITKKHQDPSVKHFSFGKNKQNFVSFQSYTVSLDGSEFHYHGDKNNLTIAIKEYALPEEYREVIAAAIAVGYSVGLQASEIQKSLQRFSPPKGRASIFQGINNTIIIDSSYNASRVATIPFLNLLDTLKRQTKRKAVFLFGDMRELGAEAEIEHKRVATKINEVVDHLCCVGPLTKEFIIPYATIKDKSWFENARDAGEYLQKNLPKDALVLVKGSQNTIFLEEAIKFILKDKKDVGKLCRQEDYWLKIKER